MSNSYHIFARNIVTVGIANLLVGASTFLLVPILTKTLGVQDYGIWSQVNVTMGLIVSIAGLGLPYAIVRFLAAKTDKIEIQKEFYSVLAIVFISAAIISSLLIIFSSFVADIFFNGAQQIVIITGLIIVVWLLDSVYLRVFPAFGQMRKYSLLTVAEVVGRVGLITVLVLKGYSLLYAVSSILVIRTILLLILIYLVRVKIGIARPRFYNTKTYLSFSLPTVPASITGWVVASSDRYVIGYFLSATAIGIYSAAYILGNIPFMLSSLLSFVLLPTVSKLYDEGKINEVKTYLSYTLKYYLMLAIPFTFGAVLLGKQVLILFSTLEIAISGQYIVGIVALGTLFSGVFNVIAHILVLIKKTKIIGMIWIVIASMNLGLNILVVPRFGILGAAVTTLISYLLALGIVCYYSFREFKFGIEFGFIVKSLASSIVMSTVIWFIAPQGTLAVILTIIAGLFIYGLTMLLLKGIQREEFGLLRESPKQ